MKIVIPLLLLSVLLTAYPIPVECRSLPRAPVDAIISQPFGRLGHVGVDYNVKVGTEVRAVTDGIVMYTTEDSRVYGRHVYILGCDGFGSIYAHLSRIDVKFGQIVTAGQVIGLSGGAVGADGSGWSSGPHLHFEIRTPGHLESNLYNADPMIYLDAAQRQLPVEMP